MQRTLGAHLSHMLRDRGVEVIFGIPGVHNQEMYRGIEEAGLRHVLARHEGGAGFMADGYARATGRPGVAYVISGPGLTNVMTPMGQAYSDSVPMLVLSSVLDETAARRGQLHQMRDQVGAARTVCEWSEMAVTPQAAYALIDRALQEMELVRPRPRHICLPIAALQGNAAAFGPAPEGSAARPGSDPALLAEAAARLATAVRPLIVLGGGAAAAPEAARALVAKSGAAVFTTYAGRGLIAADWPTSFGSFLARPGSADVFAQADLVIAIGTALSEVDLWRAHPGHSCPLIRIDIDPEELLSFPAVLRIAGDAGRAMEGIAAALPASRGPLWPVEDVAATKATWRAQIAAERPGILPVADALRACLTPEAMIFSDMTQFAYATLEVWEAPKPNLWHHPHGFGTLGYALPAAIGGAVGRPGLPTLAIAGDYGFQYTIQELAAAVELGLSLPIILWDNGKLGEIEDSMVRAQIAPNAVIQRNPDFLKLAEAYGARSAAPQTLDAFQEAVREALVAPVPTLIHATPALGATSS
ncbi:MAG: acetolactate synthase isozyme1 large subunit [Limimaricola sp.]|uniref:thiamine pyrophosphate-binding protein n=1 Tax=Limimaricola sp. TaxID=2211665 RepID=UPI001D6B34D2|nr:thiamine pyrophosphate-binding protein [Limimaricola sp.]MBI1416167.1 acetolactate synthase isozyme1 large subunit [Limimaricola sp.]